MKKNGNEDSAAVLAGRLVAWFRRQARPYAFRQGPPDPYGIWILEVMAQQTQIGRAEARQRRWLGRFPDLAALARAGLDEVLKEWEGLGYYGRARNLHRAARLLVAEGRELPATYDGLLSVPGIGPYTAASIASIVHGEAVPAVDANARRIATRMLAAGDGDGLAPVAVTADWLAGLLDCGPAGEINEAVMELGEQLCRKGQPLCADCPLAAGCRARRLGVAAAIPRVAAKEYTMLEFAVACVRRGGLLAAEPVPPGELWAGLWRLPLAPLPADPGGDGADAALAALLARLGLPDKGGSRPLPVIRHGHTRYRIRFHPRLVELRPRDAARLRAPAEWVAPGSPDAHPFPSAFLKIVAALPDA